MSNKISILNTQIRTLDSLYSLNDIHKAAGSERKHEPNLFFRLEQTRELVKEINNDENTDTQICVSNKSLRTGINKGTWACEELVLAYATWISPKFHLIVLRAFLTMHRNEPKQLSLPEQNYHLNNIQNSEEALALFIKMYSYCHQAHEMQEKLQKTNLPKQIENEIGGQYLYNFQHPLEQTMTRAKKFIQTNVERLALIKAVDHLLN